MHQHHNNTTILRPNLLSHGGNDPPGSEEVSIRQLIKHLRKVTSNEHNVLKQDFRHQMLIYINLVMLNNDKFGNVFNV